MTIAQFDDSGRITAFATGAAPGAPVPPQLEQYVTTQGSNRRLIVDETGHVVDGAAVTTWYIDPAGDKHPRQSDPSWPAVTGPWDAVVVRDASGAWTVQSAADALAVVKRQLKAQVDQQAETVRQRYLTPGAGQALTYDEKVTEATAAVADANANNPPPAAPTPDPYPLLRASVGVEINPGTGAPCASITDVANLVLATKAAWKTIAAAIEAARLGAKNAIDAAPDATTAQQIADSVAWPA